jgi:hypothetical protein
VFVALPRLRIRRAVQDGTPEIDVTDFVRGLAIGFAIAAPVGAIGLLCIRRTLADGRLVGFVWCKRRSVPPGDHRALTLG